MSQSEGICIAAYGRFFTGVGPSALCVLSEKHFVVFYIFSFPSGVYVGPLNLIASIPGHSILTTRLKPMLHKHKLGLRVKLRPLFYSNSMRTRHMWAIVVHKSSQLVITSSGKAAKILNSLKFS